MNDRQGNESNGPKLGQRPSFPGAPIERPHFEQAPLTRSEYITALSHFYRAEMHRSLVWRTRLDTTTNWAIVATLAILTTSLRNPTFAPEVILLGMFANIVFLTIEARRFRFFDVWRARVRMIEENFIGGILRRDQASPDYLWGVNVADDLLCPRFHLTRLQAFRARLVRNFRWFFLFLLLAWIANRLTNSRPEQSFGLGLAPDWALDALVSFLYLGLAAVIIFTPKAQSPEMAYFSHPDHPGEDVSSLDV